MRLKAAHNTAKTMAKSGSHASRSTTQDRFVGAVRRPGGRPISKPVIVTAMNAVWCQRNSVMAERLAVATMAQATGWRIHLASSGRSSNARPTCAVPNATTARVGGLRFEIGAPFTPTMLAG